MKAIILAACLCALSSCASKGDPAFINNAAASILGGVVTLPSGAVASLVPKQPAPSSHPFFGAP